MDLEGQTEASPEDHLPAGAMGTSVTLQLSLPTTVTLKVMLRWWHHKMTQNLLPLPTTAQCCLIITVRNETKQNKITREMSEKLLQGKRYILENL